MADATKRKAWFNLDDWSAEFAAAAIARFDAFQERLERSKRHRRIQRMWSTVYMRGKHGECDDTEIGSAGRRGEVLLLTSNRIGRLMRDHLTLVDQTKAMPDPKAANSDPDSQEAVDIGKGVCDHYKRECDLEAIKHEHAGVAEICGDAYLHIPWDPDLGNEVAVQDVEPSGEQEQLEAVDSSDEEQAERKQQRIVYEGDYQWNVRTPYEVAYDRTSPGRNGGARKTSRWWVVQEPENRFDLLAQVREEVTDPKTLQMLEHAILNAPRWTARLKKLDYDDDEDKNDDCIPVYYVYVDRCRARAAGRFAKVIDAKTVLLDAPLSEPRCPVFRLSQGEVLFRSEAMTPNHDGLPLQDALSAQLSTMTSNNANYGLTRVITPRKSNVTQTSLDAGAAVVEYDHVDKSGNPIPPPQPWSALDANPELRNFYMLLFGELDLVVGGSPVTRGDPSATQGDSGSKVAALFAAAQNIGSSFVGNVLRCWEEVFTFLIDSLKEHATTERVITIVGEGNSYAAKKYTGEKLRPIVRVTVEQADVMRDTVQGRAAMAELLKDKTPEQQKQLIAGMKTGRWEAMDDPTERPRILLERENEELRNLEMEPPIVVKNDPHVEHWKSHYGQLNDPAVRRDPKIRQRIEKHCKEHELYLTPGSPVFDSNALHITGQAPLPPSMPEAGPPSEQPGPHAGPTGPTKPPGSAEAAAPPKQGMPKSPRMPVNPVDGQQMNTGTAVPGRPQQSPVMGGG